MNNSDALRRFYGGKVGGAAPLNGAGAIPMTTDFEAENVWSVLGRWPETDADWAEVERVMGYTPGAKAGLNSVRYRRGEVMGPMGMVGTPDLGKKGY